jgi:hypothetical protein
VRLEWFDHVGVATVLRVEAYQSFAALSWRFVHRVIVPDRGESTMMLAARHV